MHWKPRHPRGSSLSPLPKYRYQIYADSAQPASYALGSLPCPDPGFRRPALRLGRSSTTFCLLLPHLAAEYLESCPIIFHRNLPRVWVAVEGHPGRSEPTRPTLSHQHPTRIGGDFDEAMLQVGLGFRV